VDSIVETEKENNLTVFEYLVYIFKRLPSVNFKNNMELLKEYLPWSESLPERCRMKTKR